MCIPQSELPETNFVKMVSERIEEIIGASGEHYMIKFHGHLSHNAVFPTNGNVNNALAETLRILNTVCDDSTEGCIFDANSDKVDHVARSIVFLTQKLILKSEVLSLLALPSIDKLRLKIYHPVINVFINYLTGRNHTIAHEEILENFRKEVKKIENNVRAFARGDNWWEH